MQSFEMQLLYRPTTSELRFLPEGPYPVDAQRFSWVAIQHSATSVSGSLNVFDFSTGTNERQPLPGRPGFAFATTRAGTFLVGLERHLVYWNSVAGTAQPVTDEIDAHVSGTVINDAVAWEQGVLFGCKDVRFEEAKAGLYLWKTSGELVRLRHDQTCSNGKVLFGSGSRRTLLDIDTPTKTVVRYQLDLTLGKLSAPERALDLTALDMYPDGMIATPDGTSVIISFYNPGDAPEGETRQYHLGTGELERVWRTPLAPQATCPQLLRYGDHVKLVVTTAVEHMSPERQALYPNSGCLFVADTEFTSLPATPYLQMPGDR
jgi:sugar lactone lactonase YvrE